MLEKFHQKISIGGESFNKGLYGNSMLYIPFRNNQINIFVSNRKTENETSSIGELDNTQSNIDNYNLSFTNYRKK